MAIENRELWIQKFKEGQSYLIISHVNPDGDTIGSALGLRLALLALGKEVSVVCDGEIPRFVSYLEGADAYLRPDQVTAAYDTAIAVDMSAPEMMGQSGPLFEAAQVRLVIDHHPTNAGFGDVDWIRRGEAACCQLVYDAILDLGIPLSTEMADCILLGLSTDTGHFQYKGTTVTTMRTATALVEAGADISWMSRQVYRTATMERVLITKKVYEKMHFACNHQIGMVEITEEDRKMTGCVKSDMEGLVNLVLDIEGVRFAFLAREVEDEIRFSLRSKYPDTINDVALRFGGGGHAQAAGCFLRGVTLSEATEQVRRAIEAKL
ncbi:MAG: DHH family phosphoesterase [Clostridia bacterium]|nr:DHH family phosphoesterase [Clostridia bacterium]